jgi:hypothetical protein
MQQLTQQASSRSIQSHKTTISTTTSSGTSEATTRMLVNPSPTDPLRIDYFSLMRKWQVSLYRYGLRLTYDVTVPEPGAAMREAYRTLAQLQQKANAPFGLDITYSEIAPGNFDQLLTVAASLGAEISAPPEPQVLQVAPANGGQVKTSSSYVAVPARSR